MMTVYGVHIYINTAVPLEILHEADSVNQFEAPDEIDEHLLDGCDTSMAAQLDDAGFGSAGVM